MTLIETVDLRLMSWAGIFFGVLFAFEGVRQMLSRRETSDTARLRRLKRIKANSSPEEVLALLRSSRRRTALQRIPVIGSLPKSMRQAGIEFSPALFISGVAAVAAVVSFAATLYFQWFIVVPGAIALSLIVPAFIVTAMRRNRTDKLVAQLPDALDLMMRGLRVGHPLNTTISNVAKNLPQPIASEFAHLADQISYGEDLPDAFADMAERIDQEDFSYLAAAVKIQHGTGGSLGRVLRTLAKVIRDRAALRRKVIALSSEGRLSAKILSALPIIIFVATNFTAPDYYQAVSDDPLFMPISLAVVTLVIVNYLALRKLVNFKA